MSIINPAFQMSKQSSVGISKLPEVLSRPNQASSRVHAKVSIPCLMASQRRGRGLVWTVKP